MLCGYRALSDYDRKEESCKSVSAALCAKETEISQAVDRLKEEQVSLKGKMASLQQKMIRYLAQEIDVSEHIVTVFDKELSGNAPRELMNQLLRKGASVCAVFAGTESGGYRYVIGSSTEDVRPLCKRLNETFAGRGGGKAEMVQGSLKGSEEALRKICKGGYEDEEI